MRTRDRFCGRFETHSAHLPYPRPRWPWRPQDRCQGAYVIECGRPVWHGPHWHGELHDELCRGTGLVGVCPHGEQLLNECRACP